ncbi:kelch-like protein 24 [Mizuhopecten yessoensis]|uniref:Kelch-like protein 40 n=1 Tax=Mizuhopecten yessoensis TaxID=6573 RepID=A0A210PRH6_MIZYE|nr:kelch-like protein 24 [Mizuhopecten yessoensis]OWF39046.1 Kelch-like protein 40 [Mizuhopecten yessoensis]
MEESTWMGTNPEYVKGTGRSQFRDFFNNSEFSDVKIFCGEKEFFGHKIVLSSCSEVFRTMLSTCNVNHLTLEENCLMEEVFEQVLEFLYTWQITFCEENITPLLMLADKYMIEDLIALGIKYMVENLSQENVIPWYKFALQFNIEALYNKCVTYLGTKFDIFFSNGELIKLEVDELMPILDSGMLVTRSELQDSFWLSSGCNVTIVL